MFSLPHLPSPDYTRYMKVRQDAWSKPLIWEPLVRYTTSGVPRVTIILNISFNVKIDVWLSYSGHFKQSQNFHYRQKNFGVFDSKEFLLQIQSCNQLKANGLEMNKRLRSTELQEKWVIQANSSTQATYQQIKLRSLWLFVTEKKFNYP